MQDKAPFKQSTSGEQRARYNYKACFEYNIVQSHLLRGGFYFASPRNLNL